MKKALSQFWNLFVYCFGKESRFAISMGILVLLFSFILQSYYIIRSDLPSETDKKKLIEISLPILIPDGTKIIEIASLFSAENQLENYFYLENEKNRPWFISTEAVDTKKRNYFPIKISLFIIEGGKIFSNSWTENVILPPEKVSFFSDYQLSDKKFDGKDTYHFYFKWKNNVVFKSLIVSIILSFIAGVVSCISFYGLASLIILIWQIIRPKNIIA